MSKIIHLIDRSRVEAREDCPRLRYLGYDFDDDGLEPDEQALPLLSGIAIHAAHARLLAGEQLDSVVTTVVADYVAEIKLRGLFGLDVTKDLIREQSALLEGMLRVWAIVRMPQILAEYEVESIEQTWDWELSPGLVQRIRMDAILKRRDDGLRHILDYKSMKYPSEIFMEQKEHDLQTCLYIQALKEHTNEPVGGILYEGLIKGAFRKDTAFKSPFFGQKMQHSPYTVAYRLLGETPSETFYQSAYTPKKGYEKIKTFDEMTMKEWVEKLRFEEQGQVARDQFVVIPVILPPSHELEAVKAQVAFEEIKYHDDLAKYHELMARGTVTAATAAEEVLARMAPKRTGRCFKYGADNRCKFLGICFNQGASPLDEGGYRKRKPHHDTDMRMVA